MSETHSKNHDYHLVDPSPWPAIGAIAAFITAIGAVIYFHQGSYWLLTIGLIAVLYTMYGWWREVIKEANKELVGLSIVIELEGLNARDSLPFPIESQIIF